MTAREESLSQKEEPWLRPSIEGGIRIHCLPCLSFPQPGLALCLPHSLLIDPACLL